MGGDPIGVAETAADTGIEGIVLHHILRATGNGCGAGVGVNEIDDTTADRSVEAVRRNRIPEAARHRRRFRESAVVASASDSGPRRPGNVERAAAHGGEIGRDLIRKRHQAAAGNGGALMPRATLLADAPPITLGLSGAGSTRKARVPLPLISSG